MTKTELYKYRIKIKNQILSDIWKEIHQEPVIRYNNEYLHVFCKDYNTEKYVAENIKKELLRWIHKNQDIVKIWQYNGEYKFTLKLLNCEIDEFESELDAEIEELETKLKELKEQRKLEKEENRKKEKIEYLKKELAKLEKEDK